MSGVEIKGQVRDGLLYCVRRKSCSFTYEMEKRSAFTGTIPGVADQMTSAEVQDTADGVKVRAKVTGTWSRESEEC